MRKRNKEKQKEWAKNHYLKNKDSIKERARRNTKSSIQRNRKYIDKYLSDHPCIDCGESDIIVLEFDHVRGEKSDNVSTMVLASYSIKSIEKEIDKCEVRCANCHRRATYIRRHNGL